MQIDLIFVGIATFLIVFFSTLIQENKTIPLETMIFIFVPILVSIPAKRAFNFPHLNINQKAKLVEILLLVVSIFAAFNQIPNNNIWIAALFVLFTVIYYIFLHSQITNELIFNSVAFLISAFFSGIFLYILGVSVYKAFPDYQKFLESVLIIYYLSSLLIIYRALKT